MMSLSKLYISKWVLLFGSSFIAGVACINSDETKSRHVFLMSMMSLPSCFVKDPQYSIHQLRHWKWDKKSFTSVRHGLLTSHHDRFVDVFLMEEATLTDTLLKSALHAAHSNKKKGFHGRDILKMSWNIIHDVCSCVNTTYTSIMRPLKPFNWKMSDKDIHWPMLWFDCI